MKTKHPFKFLLFGLIILTSFVSGCKKVNYYKLTDEEMLWLSYDNNEILRFKTPTNQFRVFYVTLRTKAYIREGNNYNEFTNAHFLQLNDTTAIVPDDSNGDLYIYKGDAGLEVTFTWPHFALKKTPLTTLFPGLVNIGGVNYTDVYVLNGSALADIRNYYTKVWVSKSEGVLQMEDTSGKTWTRVL